MTKESICYVTDHFQLRRMFRKTGTVPSDARIVPGVTCLYRFDREKADLLTTFRDQYTIGGEDLTTVEHPVDLDRCVTLRYSTINRHSTLYIGRFLSELERQQYWWNFWDDPGEGGKDHRETKEQEQKNGNIRSINALPITFSSDVCSAVPARLLARHV